VAGSVSSCPSADVSVTSAASDVLVCPLSIAQRRGELAQTFGAMTKLFGLRSLGERFDLRRRVRQRPDLVVRRQRARRRRGRRSRLGRGRGLRDVRAALGCGDALFERGEELLNLFAVRGIALEVLMVVVDRLGVATCFRIRARDVVERVRVRKDVVRLAQLRDAVVELAVGDQRHAVAKVLSRLGTHVGPGDVGRDHRDGQRCAQGPRDARRADPIAFLHSSLFEKRPRLPDPALTRLAEVEAFCRAFEVRAFERIDQRRTP